MALPAQPATVGTYPANRAATRTIATLTRRLAANSTAHRLAGHHLDTRHPAIRPVMQGIRCAHGTASHMHIVNSGIDMSVLRGRPSGTLNAVSEFLYAFDLARFADLASFGTVLDEETKALARSCAGASWGHARKCLDIFLRKATYDYYLRERYRLGTLEPVLELPLDSNVAKGIKLDAKKYGLRPPPKWDAIIRLTPKANYDWQATASEIARMRKIDRVHLDLWLLACHSWQMMSRSNA